MIYTSGSTGKPKGVQVPHRGVVNTLHAMAHEPGLDADDVLIAVSSVSFDMSVPELFGPLIAGARLVVARREEISDGAQLGVAVDESGATVMQASPAVFSSRRATRSRCSASPPL